MRTGCYLAFCLLAAAVLPAAPPEEPPLRPPPMAQARSVSGFRGRTVEIPLRGIGRSPTQLKFLIRVPPKHGRLGEIRFTGRKTAVVTYHHDEKSSATFDSFTYAVQAIDTAVSAPATVRIAIAEEPPALSVVHALDFGQVWLGETRLEEIVIRNTGGGSLAGRIVVSEPWKIAGSSEYRLLRKEEGRVRVVFAPDTAGEFSARLMFSHDPRSSVALSGAAEAPLEVVPAETVTLSLLAGEGGRAGSLTVRNRTASERQVEIGLPDAVEGPDELTLPPGGVAQVDLRVKKGMLGAIDDRVDLASEGFQRSLPLVAPAAPAILRLEPAGGLDFGAPEIKTLVRREFSVRNEGGSPARLQVEVSKEAHVIPDPTSVVLAPGETKQFQVELELTGTGRFHGKLSLGAAQSAAATLALTATGTAPPAASPPSSSVPRVTAGSPEAPSSLPDEPVSAMRPPGPVTFSALSRRSVQAAWEKTAPNAVSHLIEYRLVELQPSGPPKTVWKKWQGASFREETGQVVALLGNLPPGGTWYLRIVALDETGRRSRPSDVLRLVTPPASTIAWYWWTGGLAVVTAGAVFGWRFFLRQRQEESREEADRLARLSG